MAAGGATHLKASVSLEALSEQAAACHSRAIHSGTEVHVGGRPRTAVPTLT